MGRYAHGRLEAQLAVAVGFESGHSRRMHPSIRVKG